MEDSFTQVDEAALAAASERDTPVAGDPVPETTNDNTVATTTTNIQATAATVSSPKPVLQVFKEVPGFDPRSLVLQYGDKLLDLQFCSCVNKYKKRFTQFLKENPTLLEEAKTYALALAENGYKDIDIKDVLEYLRGAAKATYKASDYMIACPHDFSLDTLPRAYLVRKLLMEEPKLFGHLSLSPVKCRSNCGYPEAAEVEEPAASDIAGF